MKDKYLYTNTEIEELSSSYSDVSSSSSDDFDNIQTFNSYLIPQTDDILTLYSKHDDLLSICTTAYAKQDISLCVKACQKMIQLYPSKQDAYKLLCLICEDNNDVELQYLILQRLVKKNQNDTDSIKKLYQLSKTLEKHGDTLKYLKKIQNIENNREIVMEKISLLNSLLKQEEKNYLPCLNSENTVLHKESIQPFNEKYIDNDFSNAFNLTNVGVQNNLLANRNDTYGIHEKGEIFQQQNANAIKECVKELFDLRKKEKLVSQETSIYVPNNNDTIEKLVEIAPSYAQKKEIKAQRIRIWNDKSICALFELMSFDGYVYHLKDYLNVLSISGIRKGIKIICRLVLEKEPSSTYLKEFLNVVYAFGEFGVFVQIVDKYSPLSDLSDRIKYIVSIEEVSLNQKDSVNEDSSISQIAKRQISDKVDASNMPNTEICTQKNDDLEVFREHSINVHDQKNSITINKNNLSMTSNTKMFIKTSEIPEKNSNISILSDEENYINEYDPLLSKIVVSRYNIDDLSKEITLQNISIDLICDLFEVLSKSFKNYTFVKKICDKLFPLSSKILDEDLFSLDSFNDLIMKFGKQDYLIEAESKKMNINCEPHQKIVLNQSDIDYSAKTSRYDHRMDEKDPLSYDVHLKRTNFKNIISGNIHSREAEIILTENHRFRILTAIGNYFYKISKFDQSIQVFLYLLKLDECNDEIKNYLHLIYLELGNHILAKEYEPSIMFKPKNFSSTDVSNIRNKFSNAINILSSSLKKKFIYKNVNKDLNCPDYTDNYNYLSSEAQDKFNLLTGDMKSSSNENKYNKNISIYNYITDEYFLNSVESVLRLFIKESQFLLKDFFNNKFIYKDKTIRSYMNKKNLYTRDLIKELDEKQISNTGLSIFKRKQLKRLKIDYDLLGELNHEDFTLSTRQKQRIHNIYRKFHGLFMVDWHTLIKLNIFAYLHLNDYKKAIKLILKFLQANFRDKGVKKYAKYFKGIAGLGLKYSLLNDDIISFIAILKKVSNNYQLINFFARLFSNYRKKFEFDKVQKNVFRFIVRNEFDYFKIISFMREDGMSSLNQLNADIALNRKLCSLPQKTTELSEKNKIDSISDIKNISDKKNNKIDDIFSKSSEIKFNRKTSLTSENNQLFSFEKANKNNKIKKPDFKNHREGSMENENPTNSTIDSIHKMKKEITHSKYLDLIRSANSDIKYLFLSSYFPRFSYKSSISFIYDSIDVDSVNLQTGIMAAILFLNHGCSKKQENIDMYIQKGFKILHYLEKECFQIYTCEFTKFKCLNYDYSHDINTNNLENGNINSEDCSDKYFSKNNTFDSNLNFQQIYNEGMFSINTQIKPDNVKSIKNPLIDLGYDNLHKNEKLYKSYEDLCAVWYNLGRSYHLNAALGIAELYYKRCMRSTCVGHQASYNLALIYTKSNSKYLYTNLQEQYKLYKKNYN
ncbi:hypothetical protein EDEG_00314 [Edhazardia aedis USNM 41457]|uniref:Uncharacterized protein n=1 Tax=Edhazardia aedis (strain USNM 41457) TaxID=1003232 RepID=J8ZQL7_EDHAE|nr:hypothetical protein EDEG_00314 [Edhazardia aedis USNM 41457]|eukprot:EJW02008.1 hypothetical protein EDEG_00314 [Edhazardia aedis USNM 41457]